VNAGFGTVESNYEQSVAILDTTRASLRIPGAADEIFRRDVLLGDRVFRRWSHLYVSFDSLSAPEGGKQDQTGNAIGVYSFSPSIRSDALKPERLIPVRCAS